MAKSTNIKSTLIIRYHAGQDEKGKEIYKNQRINKVKPAAGDDDVFAVATVLSKFLDDPVVEVFRQNDNLIANE
ncbi:DUF1659 domain-containing protein [Clostridium ganghwense]|uniref:DUF1659 domain-containing protein n=1 Tax=Clostridium ganghwense TaxID=312089 RepID=A0ABT4CME7_9CLOT|nr:DUF1659 domain-containing protein [Clostridium ganghwense]MCY6370215.1 DUF1659 domain-containing protein [Clostridium ganghwense]